MNFCLPINQVKLLKPRMKELGGAKLTTMTREELSVFFAESVGTQNANKVANSFRDAVLSKRKNALKMWAKKTLTSAEIKKVEEVANQMTQEDTEIALYENMDADIIEKAMGITISEKEVEMINKLTEKMSQAENIETDSFSGYSEEYFKASKELRSYLDTVNPMSNLSVVSLVIFRANLLFGIKSVVTNVVGNVTGGLAEKIVNTISEKKASGVNSDLIKKYVAYATETYATSMIDVVRTMDASTGATVLGEHYKGIGSD